MNTEDLIRDLAAAGAAPRRAPVARRMGLALGGSFVVLCALALALLGARAGLGAYVLTGIGALKFLGGAVLAAAAARIACRLARPGQAQPFCPVALAAGGGVVILALALAQGGGAMPFAAAARHSWACAGPILLFAALPLTAALATLRAGAATRPAAAGAAAGLAAGALGALAYALHCPADDPALVAVGYGAGLLTCALVGAAAGSRVLAW